MKIIDLPLVRSWPEQIPHLLSANAHQIDDEKKRELAAHLDGTYLWNPPRCPVYERTKREIEQLLREYEIRAFHCTRQVDFDSIRDGGLQVLSPPVIRNIALAELAKAGLDEETLREASEAFDRFENTGEYEGRAGMLWFVLTKAMTDDSGCRELLEYFGGEVTRRALWSLRERVYPLLASIGKPAVVECRLPINDAADYQVDNMADEFIRYGRERYVRHRRHALVCEMDVSYSVPRERVLKVRSKDL